MAVPDFPTDHPLPAEQPTNIRTAVLLALFLGPLGLFYASIPGALFCLFLLVVLGLFTVGIGIIPVWLLSVLWAYLAATHSHDRAAGSEDSPPRG
ncbi:MAG TPA: hypothetical protein VEX86_07485 [Longimicrobium sp.]|nr:hypothetical protein [Longimicrobium sp.]